MMILFFASQAYPENTWILWQKSLGIDLLLHSNLPIQWDIVEAFPKYEDCIRKLPSHDKLIEMAKRVNDARAAKGEIIDTEVLGETEISTFKFSDGRPYMRTHTDYLCLPDTIDPRK